MLERESERWNDLSGPAGMSGRRVIDAIYALSNEQYIDDSVGDRLGFWEIYNQLCHQGTIYTLTYAAVPHLLPAKFGVSYAKPFNPMRQCGNKRFSLCRSDIFVLAHSHFHNCNSKRSV